MSLSDLSGTEPCDALACADTTTRRYLNGYYCPLHTPAAVRKASVPVGEWKPVTE